MAVLSRNPITNDVSPRERAGGGARGRGSGGRRRTRRSGMRAAAAAAVVPRARLLRARAGDRGLGAAHVHAHAGRARKHGSRATKGSPTDKGDGRSSETWGARFVCARCDEIEGVVVMVRVARARRSSCDRLAHEVMAGKSGDMSTPAVMQDKTRRKASRRAASSSARGRPPAVHRAWSWAESSASSPRGFGLGGGAPGWRMEAVGWPEWPRGGVGSAMALFFGRRASGREGGARAADARFRVFAQERVFLSDALFFVLCRKSMSDDFTPPYTCLSDGALSSAKDRWAFRSDRGNAGCGTLNGPSMAARSCAA